MAMMATKNTTIAITTLVILPIPWREAVSILWRPEQTILFWFVNPLCVRVYTNLGEKTLKRITALSLWVYQMGNDNLREAIENIKTKMDAYRETGASLKSQQYAKMANQYAELTARAKALGIEAKAKKQKLREVKLSKEELRKTMKAFRA
jgi:hypothetical protein